MSQGASIAVARTNSRCRRRSVGDIKVHIDDDACRERRKS